MRAISARPDVAHLILRCTVGLIFLSHGITRTVTDRVTPFGVFLDKSGFPGGLYWAWGVTLWELAGGALLVLGFQARIASLVFIVQMLFGIWLVHWKSGWFVVGHGFNGMEYSVLIIAACLGVIFTAKAKGEVA